MQADDPQTLPHLHPPDEYPRNFGNYILLTPIARGGMGEVFLAKSGSVAGLEKYCVLKTLRPHLTDDREYSARFIDEARIVVQLNHRNICQVFDVGIVGERYYLAMEYVAGVDLRTVQAGRLETGVALHIVCEVLEALDYAHRHVDPTTGEALLLVHRDVSPQNVMVSWEGEVKLIDFGLAASSIKVEQTEPNVVMGKVAYMSPEQAHGERVDSRSDLFAVAVMLYELLAGERFYEGRGLYEIAGLAAQGGFRPRGWAAVPPDLQAILTRALATAPAARFATCAELREALEAYRYASGLRGDTSMLRALVRQAFAAAIDESRKRLAALSQLSVADVRAATASATIDEPTQLIARAMSRPMQTVQRRLHEVKDATEPTQMMVKELSAQRRRRFAAAALAALAAAGALGVTLWWPGDAAAPHIEALDVGFAATAPAVAPQGRPPLPPETVAPAETDADARAETGRIVDAGNVSVVAAVADRRAAKAKIPKKAAAVAAPPSPAALPPPVTTAAAEPDQRASAVKRSDAEHAEIVRECAKRGRVPDDVARILETRETTDARRKLLAFWAKKCLEK